MFVYNADAIKTKLKTGFLAMAIGVIAMAFVSCGKTAESSSGSNTSEKSSSASVSSDTQTSLMSSSSESSTAVTTPVTQDTSTASSGTSTSKSTSHKPAEESTSKTTTTTTRKTTTSEIDNPATTSSQTDKTTTSSQTTSKTTSEQGTTTTTKASTTSSEAVVTTIKPAEPIGVYDSLLERVPASMKNVALEVHAEIQKGTAVIALPQRSISESDADDFAQLLSLMDIESSMQCGGYKCYMSDGYIVKLEPEHYSKTAKQLSDEISAVNKVADKVVSDAVKSCPTEFDKVLYFHNYIINNCSYDLSAENGSTAYGCLVEGKAVCEGYSKAMILLCSKAGIKCLSVMGYGSETPHMWNLICIDGCWTNVDVTWDDIENSASGISYCYMGMTDKDISADHTATVLSFIDMPVADSTSSGYYVRKGFYITSQDRAEEILKSAVDEAYRTGSRTITVRCSSKEIYNHLCAKAEGGAYKYEHLLTIMKEAKNKYGSDMNAGGFLLDNSEGTKSRYIFTIYLKS